MSQVKQQWMVLLALAITVTGRVRAAEPTVPPTAPAALTLPELEQMAVRGNPTLAQAAAKVEAAQGRTVQAGLYPNPTVGYVGEEIGNGGKAGQQGRSSTS